MAFDLASAKPIAPQKTGSFDLSSVKEPEAKEKKKKMSDYLLPAMFSGYEPERGDRTIWGDIGERPGAAIRSGIRSKANIQATL